MCILLPDNKENVNEIILFVCTISSKLDIYQVLNKSFRLIIIRESFLSFKKVFFFFGHAPF